MNEPELKINGTYLVENDGTIQGMDIENKIYTDKLDINLSGQTPTGGYLEYENSKLKNGCLTFDEYKVTIENGEAQEVEKGSCKNQSLTACDSPNFIESDPSWFTFDASTKEITGFNDDEWDGTTDIVIPCSIGGVDVESIRGGSFLGKGLTSLIVGDSVKIIDGGAFVSNNLSSVIIGNNVTKIGSGAFSGTGIKTLKLGASVELIEIGAFSNNLIEELIIPDSVVIIGVRAFTTNKIEKLTLGNGLIEIGDVAFPANNLKSVVIPSNVTSIGFQAFAKGSASNPNLTTIYNNTGKEFDWGSIVGGNYNPETGIVENGSVNVEIKKSVN